MKFVSLFAGVGGFDLGFERAGWECVGQVDIDKHARAVLEKHWPDVPKHDDVTTAIGWADELGLVGNVDLVCGGFPCQDVSVAGKRAGLAGQRTGLFWDALAFATHVEAGWLVLENVPGLLSSNSGRDFGVVISAMADAGYRHIEWRVLDSQFFGVPQRRRRVFIIGSVGVPSGRAVLVEREGMRWDPAEGGEAGTEAAGTAQGSIDGGRWAGGASAEGVAAPLGALTGGPRTSDIESATFVVEPPLSLSLSPAGVRPVQHGWNSQHGEGEGLQRRDGPSGHVIWCRDVMGTLGTTFGSKNYSNVQEVSQGSVVVVDGLVREVPQGGVR